MRSEDTEFAAVKLRRCLVGGGGERGGGGEPVMFRAYLLGQHPPPRLVFGTAAGPPLHGCAVVRATPWADFAVIIANSDQL